MKDELTMQLELLEKQKQDLIKEMDRKLSREKDIQYIKQYNLDMTNAWKRSNDQIRSLFEYLISEAVLKDIVSLESKVNELTPPSRYTNDLQPEDYEVLEIELLFIKTPWGNIDMVERGKYFLPHKIQSRYQPYTYKGTRTKLVNQIKIDDDKKKHLDLKQNIGNFWMNRFTQMYPQANIKFTSDWVKMGRNHMEIPLIKIVFPNKSWVEVRLYGTTKYTIYRKYDNSLATKSAEEIIQYLSL